MALMHLAAQWRNIMGARAAIEVATVDHGLRPEGAAEAAFVANAAATLGLAHTTLRWEGEKPHSSLQAAARKARYQLLSGLCQMRRNAALVTAHTRDDQVETFVMRLKRGSGVDGLAAMAACSSLDGLTVLRPLLHLPKSRLRRYVDQNGIQVLDDPSNISDAFERVKIRNALRNFKQAGIDVAAFARSIGRLARAREALDLATERCLSDHFRVTPLGKGIFDLKAFLALPSEIQVRCASKILQMVAGSALPPRLARVETLIEGICKGPAVFTLGGCYIRVSHRAVAFYREPGRMNPEQQAPAGQAMEWDGRFRLSLLDGLPSSLEIRPLTDAGKLACKAKAKGNRTLEKRLSGIDWRAAVTTPAVFEGQMLRGVPLLRGQLLEILPDEPAIEVKLVPRLSRFLKAN